MVTITRQGIGSAVVRVPVADLAHPTAPWLDKEEAKALAVTFLTVNSTWSTGRTEATRATLDAECKFYSVTVRHYTK